LNLNNMIEHAGIVQASTELQPLFAEYGRAARSEPSITGDPQLHRDLQRLHVDAPKFSKRSADSMTISPAGCGCRFCPKVTGLVT
jgi:hypothetical protein